MWVVAFWVITLVASNKCFELTYTFIMEAGSSKVVGYAMAWTVIHWPLTLRAGFDCRPLGFRFMVDKVTL